MDKAGFTIDKATKPKRLPCHRNNLILVLSSRSQFFVSTVRSLLRLTRDLFGLLAGMQMVEKRQINLGNAVDG
jgi:hypothetical protein